MLGVVECIAWQWWHLWCWSFGLHGRTRIYFEMWVWRYQIEMLVDGGLTGHCYNHRQGHITDVLDYRASFPTPEAAEVYAIEYGFEPGKNVIITAHPFIVLEYEE